MDEATLQRINDLRTKGLSAKEIARAVKLSPAVVGEIVRNLASSQAPKEEAGVTCLVSAEWRTGLSLNLPADAGSELTALTASQTASPAGLPELLHLFVTRPASGGLVDVSVFLLDLCCLGVKNAFRRKRMDQAFVQSLVEATEDNTGQHFDVISTTTARELLFGCVDYARSLGFEPNEDFATAAAVLGPWQGPSRIQFGWFGRPFYVDGPNDDPAAIIATLNRTVGKGNYGGGVGFTEEP